MCPDKKHVEGNAFDVYTGLRVRCRKRGRGQERGIESIIQSRSAHSRSDKTDKSRNKTKEDSKKRVGMTGVLPEIIRGLIDF